MKPSVLFMIIGFLLLLFLGYMHENVHKEIYRSYDIESKITINVPDLVTISEKPCPTEECKLAHNINEAVGYPLICFYVMIYFACAIIIKVIEK